MPLSATEILEKAKAGTDAATVERVFGAPIERDGVTVVPVAVVGGGAGGGGGGESGEETADGKSGSGGGYGYTARPAGVYVIRNGEAQWRPAVDVNKIVLGGQLVGVVALLVIRSLLRRRR
ncbi:spore germination protein GerW family protein [Actinoplanes sp. G11-F43]|uniref:spore germination protein GerW family protein n=1 Tax=Actinoplanes sp. G11-F43 TaxID=3424130 RepID=UPI003D3420CF